jgi:hypothetical protein
MRGLDNCSGRRRPAGEYEFVRGRVVGVWVVAGRVASVEVVGCGGRWSGKKEGRKEGRAGISSRGPGVCGRVAW